jgi:hypothetical protein
MAEAEVIAKHEGQVRDPAHLTQFVASYVRMSARPPRIRYGALRAALVFGVARRASSPPRPCQGVQCLDSRAAEPHRGG